jgi:Zn-dependent protease
MRSVKRHPSPSISFNFILLLGVAALAGASAVMVDSRLAVFFFVTAGWLISLCLHEFGHALAAYRGGDTTMPETGYLTLDPLKYTHPLLSIVLPLVFLALGGLGLPGGAVYIRTDLIRSRGWRSLTSAAGLLANLLVLLVLVVPFVLDVVDYTYAEFWAGWAMLAYLELTAIFINLLPIPGIDGFGILEPWLDAQFTSRLNFIRPLGFFILFGLFAYVPFFRDSFFSFTVSVAEFLRLDLYLIGYGLELFRFWQG